QLGAAERSQARRWVRDGARRLSRASDARRGHGLHALPDHCRRALPRRTARDPRSIGRSAMTAPPADAPDETPSSTERLARRIVSSADLFKNARELVIIHGADEYRL